MRKNNWKKKINTRKIKEIKVQNRLQRLIFIPLQCVCYVHLWSMAVVRCGCFDRRNRKGSTTLFAHRIRIVSVDRGNWFFHRILFSRWNITPGAATTAPTNHCRCTIPEMQRYNECVCVVRVVVVAAAASWNRYISLDAVFALCMTECVANALPTGRNRITKSKPCTLWCSVFKWWTRIRD